MADQRFIYRLTLKEDDNGTILVTSPDLEGLATYGADEADAKAKAIDAIRALVSHLMEEGRDVPQPGRPRKGEPTVTLPTLLAGKLALYRAMRATGVTQRGLAKLLRIDERQVRRLLDPLNASRFDEIDAALHALGQRPELVIHNVSLHEFAGPRLHDSGGMIGRPVRRFHVIPTMGSTEARAKKAPRK